MINLVECFKNVREVQDKWPRFILHQEGADRGEFICLDGREWHVTVDNFPSPKRYYATNFPIRSAEEFAHEMKRIGLDLELKETNRE